MHGTQTRCDYWFKCRNLPERLHRGLLFLDESILPGGVQPRCFHDSSPICLPRPIFALLYVLIPLLTSSLCSSLHPSVWSQKQSAAAPFLHRDICSSLPICFQIKLSARSRRPHFLFSSLDVPSLSRLRLSSGGGDIRLCGGSRWRHADGGPVSAGPKV